MNAQQYAEDEAWNRVWRARQAERDRQQHEVLWARLMAPEPTTLWGRLCKWGRGGI